mmetsp:Transcript_10795/g.33550  ORF Transcript_10795/g.33550 Transcript_10795/m.33550 type:complete len:220 (-) Transcript_10795:506-1165(-)
MAASTSRELLLSSTPPPGARAAAQAPARAGLTMKAPPPCTCVSSAASPCRSSSNVRKGVGKWMAHNCTAPGYVSATDASVAAASPVRNCARSLRPSRKAAPLARPTATSLASTPSQLQSSADEAATAARTKEPRPQPRSTHSGRSRSLNRGSSNGLALPPAAIGFGSCFWKRQSSASAEGWNALRRPPPATAAPKTFVSSMLPPTRSNAPSAATSKARS